MEKRELILNAMGELLASEKGATCSVSDIARKAGIAKGGMYYYFKSKEDVFDALVERTYNQIIEKCSAAISAEKGNALKKLQLLFYIYTTSIVDRSIDEYLHHPNNALIHQKSLAKILTSLSCVFTQIINEGISEGLFRCEYPEGLAQIILSNFCFLLDPGIFDWTEDQRLWKLTAISKILEHELNAPKGSFDFITMKSS